MKKRYQNQIIPQIYKPYLPPPLPKTINNYTFALNKSKLTAADTDLRVGKSYLCMIALEVTCVRGERGGGWGGGVTLEHSPVKR